jgi:hypothetical protein
VRSPFRFFMTLFPRWKRPKVCFLSSKKKSNARRNHSTPSRHDMSLFSHYTPYPACNIYAPHSHPLGTPYPATPHVGYGPHYAPAYPHPAMAPAPPPAPHWYPASPAHTPHMLFSQLYDNRTPPESPHSGSGHSSASRRSYNSDRQVQDVIRFLQPPAAHGAAILRWDVREPVTSLQVYRPSTSAYRGPFGDLVRLTDLWCNHHHSDQSITEKRGNVDVECHEPSLCLDIPHPRRYACGFYVLLTCQ